MESGSEAGWRVPPGIFEHLAMGACIALGCWLRWRGAFDGSIPPWFDEEIWAYRLVREPLTDLAIRPIALMAVARWLVGWLGPTETALRLLPWLTGMAVPFVAVCWARRTLASSAARILLVAAFALHPLAIDFSKEFKAYSESLCLHLLCLLLALGYYRSRRNSWLWAAVGTSFIGVLFAQDAVFFLPSFYLVMFVRAARERRFGHIAVMVGGAISAITLIGLLYWFIWRKEGAGGESESVLYWARRYDVFFIPGTGSRLAWISRKLFAVAAWGGLRREEWSEVIGFGPLLTSLKRADRGLWCSLTLMGIASLGARRRWAELALLVTPPALTLLFNQLGYWPFGVFRTNLFLLAYVIPLAAHAFDFPAVLRERAAAFGVYLPRLRRASSVWALAPASILVVFPVLFLQRNWHAKKNDEFLGNSYFADATRKLLEVQGRVRGDRLPLLIDEYTCHSYKYQLGMNPRNRALARAVAHQYRVRCAKQENLWDLIHRVGVHEHGMVWAFTSDWPALAQWLAEHPEDVRVSDRFIYGQTELALVKLVPAP